MRTQDDEEAVKKVLIHLSKICMRNGLANEVFNAFEQARPELASKHLKIAGGCADAAGAALCLDASDEDHEYATGLTNYLFGEATRELESFSKLIESLMKARTKLDSIALHRNQTTSLKTQFKATKRKDN